MTQSARAIPAVLRPARLMEGATVREFAEGLDIKPKTSWRRCYDTG